MKRTIHLAIAGAVLFIGGAAIVCVEGCNKDDNSPASVVFYKNKSWGTGPIQVVFDGGSPQLVSNYQTGGTQAFCGQNGYATFSNFPAGTYTWTASNQNGYSASGTVTLPAGKCTDVLLP
jgi:hypothetical protein